MAISRMQEPRQLYGLGSIVKKAVRGVKKIAKSPIGKAAIGGALAFGIPGTGIGGLFGRASLGGGATGLFGQKGIAATLGAGRAALANRFGPKAIGVDKFGKTIFQRKAPGFLSSLNPFGGNFSGKNAFLTAGALATAAPFIANAFGGEEVEEEDVDVMDVGAVRQSARDYYRGLGGENLAFMPQKQYVQSNFYAADGGRAGYADGMMVEDEEEEEFIRSGAGQRIRPRPAFLSMGGDAGNAQAEQMLMAEYVKYKNKGGTLSFEQFVKAVMQQQAPEGAGMEQPQAVAMAGNGGRIGYKNAGIVNLMSKLKTGMQNVGGKFKSLFDDADISIQVRDEDVMTDYGPQAQAVGQDVFIAPKSKKAVKVIEDLIEEGYDITRDAEGEYIINALDEGALDIISKRLRLGGKDIDEFMGNYDDYYSGGDDKMIYEALRNRKAEGGIMETEEASEMIDMGGMEKDYRNEGGFVAMGGKERADDVPARLSKNEFVFTADAVRNAGGGDIDKGAEVMENLMNNLEAGGEVSEDSQGLKGAQAMYDQQQMLQSRMI